MDTDSTGGALAVRHPAPPDPAAGRSPSVPAYVAGAVSAVLLVAGAVLPVATGVERGFDSVPLLVVLAVAPMVVVAALALRGRHQTAAGVLAAVAALAPGRLVLDLVLLTDPLRAARPELFRLHSLAEPGTGAGVWCLLAGHLAAVVAGIIATRAAAPKADAPWTPRTSAAAEAAEARATRAGSTTSSRAPGGGSSPASTEARDGSGSDPRDAARGGDAAATARAGSGGAKGPAEAGAGPVAARKSDGTVASGIGADSTGTAAGAASTEGRGASAAGSGSSTGRTSAPATETGTPGPGDSASAWPEGTEVGRGGLIVGMFAAVVAAVGVMMAPFTSTDAFLPAASAFESPVLVLTGSLLLAFALPVATVLLAGSGTAVARGGLLGLGVTAAVVGLPNLVSGLSLPGVRLSAGPILVLVGAAGLIAAAFLPTAATRDAAQDDEAGEITMPGIRRLRIVTGVLAVLTAAAAVAGALTPQVVIAGNLSGPQSPSRSALLVAGLLVGVLGLVMFTAVPAGYVRPVLSVAWVTVPLAGTAVLTMAVTATELGAGLTPGPGVLWTALAIVGAAITACCSVVAGMVERDETTDPATAFGEGAALPGADLLTPLVAAGILAIGAFGTPSILAPDYVEPALWSSFGTPSWGLLVALLTVLGACVLAPRCRPARAAALLAGAACVAGLRAAELPLVGDQIAGAHAGLGWWLALGCALALVIAAVLAARGTIHTPKTRSGSIR
ncbi:hypothetical protein [Amycolatopsis thermophila]|uniref:Integral membrane protein n=1 Tax=Amycolatopsis thermophila TaxID=206084 RepID=A0ABU0EQB5_9PSEU|nr:hypothetical protein [Amycolatopsis thermophila]MDQ0377447.1 hypothetical protein [Amycolatopsis thermophila]